MRNLKKFSKLALALTVLLAGSITTAQASTTITGGPFTNLQPTGQVVTLKLAGYPANKGFYLMQCVRSEDEKRPSVCNAAASLWISTATGANFLPTADIQFRPNATFTYGSRTIDCLKNRCGIFFRLDHNFLSDRSEDQFLPISFINAPTPTPTINKDVITVTINGKRIRDDHDLVVRYRDSFKIDAVAKSGAALTYATTSTTCSLTGNQLTVLKGSGECDVTITSPGNTQYSTTTIHLIFRVLPGIQSVTVNNDVSPRTTITLPNLSNFGEKVSYRVSNTANCTLNGYALTFNKVGACFVRASAAEAKDLYKEMNQVISFKIR